MNRYEVLAGKPPLPVRRSGQPASRTSLKWIGTFVLVLATALPWNAHAEAAPKARAEAVSHTVLERQLRELEVKWLSAETNGNTAYLDRMSTSRYVEILPNGQVITKAGLLQRASMRRGKAGLVFTLVCFRLRALFGNVAVVTDHVDREISPGASKTVRHELVTRIFVHENGEWKMAALAVYPVGYKPSRPAVQEGEHVGALGPGYAEESKQLWQVDQEWEGAVRKKDVPYLAKLFDRQCFIVLPGPRLADKIELLGVVGKAPRGNEVKAYPDQFKLRSVYGNFAVATDRTVLHGAVVAKSGSATEFRTLKFFIKRDGTWKVAGAADVPIVRAK